MNSAASAIKVLNTAIRAAAGAFCIYKLLLRQPAGLADGLALKEPAPPPLGGLAPELLVPPLPDSLSRGLGKCVDTLTTRWAGSCGYSEIGFGTRRRRYWTIGSGVPLTGAISALPG